MTDTQPPRTAADALAAAIRRSIVTWQETPHQMAERILADPEYEDALREALEGLVTTVDKVVNQYGDKGWAKSEMCRWLRLANREARAALAVHPSSGPTHEGGLCGSIHEGFWCARPDGHKGKHRHSLRGASPSSGQGGDVPDSEPMRGRGAP